MYGLKEAGVIVFDQLVRKLKRFGYEPMPQTPGPCRHTSCKTTFTLCVGNFGIQYFSKSDADANHLIDAIQDTYECSIDWKGTQYCGLTLAWNCPEGYFDISMPGYVKKALKKFNHKPPKRPDHASHDWASATSPCPKHPDSGDIPPAKQLSHSALTTSESSTSQKPTPTT